MASSFPVQADQEKPGRAPAITEGEYLIRFRVGGKGSMWWEQTGETTACNRGDCGRGGVTLILSSEGRSIMCMLLSEDRSNSTLTSPLLTV